MSMCSEEKRKLRKALRIGSSGGFTLIEAMVCVGIIGMIAGLLLPAVLGSRESARRTWCAKSLKDLIAATHSFEATWGRFPSSLSANYAGSPPKASHVIGFFSLQCTLLPFIEETSVYNNINFALDCSWPLFLAQNHGTVASTRVSGFLCPSDPHTDPGPFAPNNYRANTGTGRWIVSGVNSDWVDDGVFRPLPLAVAEIRDGLSHTIAYSEKPVGTPIGMQFSLFRDWVIVNVDGRSPENILSICSNIKDMNSFDVQTDAGRSWMLPGAIYTHFLVSAPPNTLTPDCGSRTNSGSGIFAARSYHPGGVNAAMADGSVHWFKSGISQAVWQSLGTRAGGEVTE